MKNYTAKNKKILILGSTGMLGFMVGHYLHNNSSHIIHKTSRKSDAEYPFDATKFIQKPSSYSFIKNYDYIVNCIGILKPYTQNNATPAIVINALFPHVLSDFTKNTDTKIIQIATDCVFSGDKGDYGEDDPHDAYDVYGKTKSLGEVNTHNFLNIRCSIIGPYTDVNLMEWFFSQKAGTVVQGFSQHIWNGVTTLQFAELCKKIIEKNKFNQLNNVSPTQHFIPNQTVTKYELLSLINTVFDRKCLIQNVNGNGNGKTVDRSLTTRFNSLELLYSRTTLKKALEQLRNYMKDYKLSIYA